MGGGRISVAEVGVGGSAAAGAQHASSEGAEVQMASPAGMGVEGVVSEARSCSVWIAKPNQASGSTTNGPAGAVEIRRSRPRRNLTTTHQESGNFLLPLFPPFSALFSCIRQKKEEKEEQKEINLFLFLLMGKRQKKEEKGASPSFFSLL